MRVNMPSNRVLALFCALVACAVLSYVLSGSQESRSQQGPAGSCPRTEKLTRPPDSTRPPVLAFDRNLVNISWTGRLRGTDDSAVELLDSVRVGGENPCETLLQCTVQIAALVAEIGREVELIVATGRGSTMFARPPAAFPYPVVAEKRPHNSPHEIVLRVARSIRRPTIFAMTNHDVDFHGMNRRLPHTWAAFINQTMRYKLLFVAHCSPIVDIMGRVAPRTIPIPHPEHLLVSMAERLGAHPPCVAGNSSTEQVYASRPRKVFWRGVTTGMHYADSPPRVLNEQYLAKTDRGRTVALFAANPSISDVFFSRVVQGQDSAHHLAHSGIDEHKWHCAGRVFVDVDGNSNAWEGLRWKLHHGGPILKINSTELHVQWYYHMLQDRVHLRHVDLDRDDVIAAAVELLDNVTLAETLMRNAVEFARTRISVEAAIAYMEDAVARCWENAAEFATRDWRIRSHQ